MKKRLKTLSFLLFFLFSNLAVAGNEVDYPYLGIKFTNPDGWQGRETEIGYMLGSHTEPGFILMRTHEAKTVETLRQEAAAGIYEDGGTSLQLEGEMEPVTAQGVGGTFSGTVEYQPAKAYIAAVINPFGKGVTILAVTDQQNFSARYQQLAQALAKSLKFAHPVEPPAVAQWKDALKGAKLTYLSTSGGSDYSGGYSGTSSRSEILLCANQQFSYYDSSHSSFDASSGFGYASNSDNGQGTWEVSNDDGGNTLVLLHFNDGREFEYRIDYRDDKTYLNDTRYFRTYDHGEC
ncbi:MAG: hypothetical protein AAF353_16655 [Pseudomonadota bacterium]